ncbi:MAG TPA: protein-disulfide reductase DsbD domain-containing protein [Candidatus Acidoferrum sp.]|nr:protein-disulfide reductase DsbD domain-containing protein [Candidatus Acidoferrum sp.]
MRRHTRNVFCAVIFAAICCGVFVVTGSAQEGHRPAVVTPHVYVSLEPVPQGREFQIAVVADINSEYHMNSHMPTDVYLIPTTLTPEMPKGFELVDTLYPNGRLEKFSFSPDKPLSVYSGSVTLRLAVQANANAGLGEVKIPMTLRYQACSDTTCLPPAKLPIEATFRVVREGTAAREVHTEIFAALRNLR